MTMTKYLLSFILVASMTALTACSDGHLNEEQFRQDLVGYRLVWDGPYPNDAPSQEMDIREDGTIEIVVTQMMTKDPDVRRSSMKWRFIDDKFCVDGEARCYHIYGLEDEENSPPKFRFENTNGKDTTNWRRVGKIAIP